MRITDPGIEENTKFGPPSVPSIMNQIKNRQTPTDDSAGVTGWQKPQSKEGFSLDSPRTVQAEPQSAKLKNMLAGLKKTND